MELCALCKEEKELQKSHFIASSFYKAVAQGHAPYDEAPVLHDFETGKVFRTNKQPQKRLLCSECEQLFSSKGENEVAKMCHRKDGKFLLRDILNTISASGVSSKNQVYFNGDGEVKDHVDLNSFVYFVISLLWRGSVTLWPKPFDGSYRSLGDNYEEKFGNYLLGRDALPDQFKLDIYVDFDEPSDIGIIAPVFSRERIHNFRFHLHSFFIPGLRFNIWLGKDVEKINNMNFQNSTSKVKLIKWSFTGSEFYKAARLGASKNKVVGKLANEVKEIRKN